METAVQHFPPGRRRVAGWMLLSAGLLATSGYALAATFCVSTASELQGALDASANGGAHNGEDNFILIERGTYKTGAASGNEAFHYLSYAATGALYIAGGYDPGCPARDGHAASTILDGNHATQVLSIINSHANVEVNGLTIQNGETTLDGGGLAINDVSAQLARVVVSDLIVRNNHTTGQYGGLYVGAGAYDLYLESNLIVGNSSDSGPGAGVVVPGTGLALVYNNTVAQNTTSVAGGIGGLLLFNLYSTGYVLNNIFWNNTHVGVYFQTSDVALDYNDYGTAGGSTPNESSGNLSTAPKFVDGAGGDFHLAGDSPLLGISPYIVASSADPDGNALAGSGGRGDLGAYYETIFVDGFEP